MSTRLGQPGNSTAEIPDDRGGRYHTAVTNFSRGDERRAWSKWSNSVRNIPTRRYAKVYDVIVATDRRGAGVGRELMAAVVGHSDLVDLNLELTCREGLVPFYADCGFEEYDVTVDVGSGEEPLVTMMYWRQRPDE